MHVDEEQIQRLLHAELDPATRTMVQGHLESCALCGERLAAARQEEADVLRLLTVLDEERPRIDVRQLMVRPRVRGGLWMRWAAGVVLSVGIFGTAYAAPGSPLRRWMAEFLEARSGEPAEVSSSVAPQAPSREPRQDPAASGLSMPAGADLLVLFADRQSAGQLRVVLGQGTDVSVTSLVAGIPFRADVGRLVVENRGGVGDFEVVIPRDARRVEIRVGTDRVYLKEGNRVTAAGSADGDGVHLIPFVRAP